MEATGMRVFRAVEPLISRRAFMPCAGRVRVTVYPDAGGHACYRSKPCETTAEAQALARKHIARKGWIDVSE